MNVLIVADLVVRSGVGNYIVQLSKELVRQGHKVIVASPRKEVELAEGVLYYPLKSSSIKNTFANAKAVKKICKEHAVDVIHAQHRNVTFYLRFCRRYAPIVVTYHTSKYPKNKLKDMLVYWGDECISISTEVRAQLLQKGVKEKKLHMVFNGVENAPLLPLTAKEKEARKEALGYKDKTVFVMHGRIHEIKGVDLLVDAVKEMTKEELGRVKFVLSGEKKGEYYQSLLQKIEENGLQPYFDFIGWTTSFEILSIADMMLAPSRQEGFPLSVIEAMFMKVPVSRTRTGGYEDMKDYVLPMEMESPEDILRQIRRYLADKGQYEGLVESAYEFAEAHCTIERMTQATVAVYEQAKKGKK